jgi:hypothetical protein
MEENIDLSGAEPQLSWVSANDTGEWVVIATRNVSPDKRKLDLEIHLQRPGFNGEQRRMSLWGPNLAFMINVYGPSTAGWKGKHVMIEMSKQDGKTYRRLALPP